MRIKSFLYDKITFGKHRQPVYETTWNTCLSHISRAATLQIINKIIFNNSRSDLAVSLICRSLFSLCISYNMLSFLGGFSLKT